MYRLRRGYEGLFIYSFLAKQSEKDAKRSRGVIDTRITIVFDVLDTYILLLN